MRRYLEAVIAGRERGLFASCYKGVMVVPSMLYGMALHGRHFCYRVGVFKQVKLSVPVVSIGNVVCGGTGKTQLVIVLAKMLMQKRRIAIVSRGYPVFRGKPKEVKAQSAPHVCGDEAVLLARRLPEALVVVGKSRVEAAKLAMKRGAEIVLLDDGMQHRRLRRDVEIGMGPSVGHYLPRGRLRDLPSRLKRAQLHLEEADMKIRPVGVFSLTGEAIETPKRVSLFCGIGNPKRFVKTVEELGCEIVQTRFLADHETIGEKEIATLAQGVDAVVCTEKDWVKLRQDLPYPICWVKCELDIVGQHAAWKKTLEAIGAL